MAKKNITIDDLDLMVGKGFDGVDKKIDTLDKKVDAGFKAVNARLDKLLSDKIENLERRMARLEEALVIK